MTEKPSHHAAINKRGRAGMWWAECTCGWQRSYQLKGDARQSAKDHMEENE